jgi:DhnA family fructose-bisphosphate aldolase class Ia
MEENATEIVKTTLRSRFTRKTLIVTAAVAGIIIAGGLAVLKSRSGEDGLEIDDITEA